MHGAPNSRACEWMEMGRGPFPETQARAKIKVRYGHGKQVDNCEMILSGRGVTELLRKINTLLHEPVSASS